MMGWIINPLSIMVTLVVASFAVPFYMVWPVVKYIIFFVAGHVLEPKRCPCPLEARLGKGEGSPGHAIYMLVQVNDTVPDMIGTLDALRLHYNDCFNKDVFLFHDGSVPLKSLQHINEQHPHVRTVLTTALPRHWRTLPPQEKAVNHPVQLRRYARASWSTLGVYDYLSEKGYKFVMQLTPGARLLSCISTDLFAELQSSGQSFFYRTGRRLPARFGTGMPYMTQDYFKKLGADLPPRLARRFSQEFRLGYWDHWVHDSGFTLTRISFWKSPEVRKFLEHVDATRVVYHNDIPVSMVQTFALLMFMPETGERRLNGWSYFNTGAMVVPHHTLVPTLFSSLLPPSSEWFGSMDDFLAHPRYQGEMQWVIKHLIKPVTFKKYWNFKILGLIR